MLQTNAKKLPRMTLDAISTSLISKNSDMKVESKVAKKNPDEIGSTLKNDFKTSAEDSGSIDNSAVDLKQDSEASNDQERLQKVTEIDIFTADTIKLKIPQVMKNVKSKLKSSRQDNDVKMEI